MTSARITLIGGPTALIELDGFRLLTDPTFDPPGEYQLPHVRLTKTSHPALSTEEVGSIDAVLLSHDQHADAVAQSTEIKQIHRRADLFNCWLMNHVRLQKSETGLPRNHFRLPAALWFWTPNAREHGACASGGSVSVSQSRAGSSRFGALSLRGLVFKNRLHRVRQAH